MFAIATLKDVARLAGVSPSTVSRVLNGEHAASQRTSEKIWQAVRETGYSVNETERRLRRPDDLTKISRQAIDCVFARDIDSFVDPFFTALLRIFEAEVFKRDYHLRCQYLVSELEEHLDDSHRKDAAVILGRVEKEALEKLKGNYSNLVYIGLQDNDLGIDSVICSGYSAAVQGLEYLISEGHRRICYLGETQDEQRYRAYCDVMKRHRADGCEVQTVRARFTPSDGYAKMRDALESGLDATAVFCANDISALGVFRALREKRLTVPGDVSVLGINDVESVRYLEPMLTVVNVPIEEMGRQAARLLMDRIEHGHRLPVKLYLPSELIPRASCARPPR